MCFLAPNTTCLVCCRFADFLLRRKTKRKPEQEAGSLVLDKQIWFHGKITAEYAERCMRRQGDFLVREDPAKPGSCFLVVRGPNKTVLHLPINKVKSSKGNRIKYQIEDASESFDSISELINHHVQLKTPLTHSTGAVITNVVSRDTTLLADEVFGPGVASNELFRHHNTDANAFATIRRTPVITRARERERRNSDPSSMSTRASADALTIDRGLLSSGKGATATASPVAMETAADEAAPEKNDSSDKTVDPEDLYDKPENNSLAESFYDKPGGQHMAEDYYDKPDTQDPQEIYDKPENNSLLEELYDKPCNNTGNASALGLSGSSATSQESRSDSHVRPSPPVIDSKTAELERCPNSQPLAPANENANALYSVPPLSKPADENDKSAVEAKEGSRTQEYVACTDEKSHEEPRKDRSKIYLGVIQKIQALMVEPFLRCDTLSLARHMTRLELEELWRQDLERKAWSLVDGSGGAEGLEILTLPQGRSRRSRLIDR